MSSAKRLAREILDTRRLALGHATSPQLTSSAIDGGGIDFRDAEGNPIAGIGVGDDGGFVIDYSGGPKPPKPSPPTVTADAGIFRIEWDGSFVNEGDEGVLATSDTDRVEIHASMDENFVPDRVESFGGAFATLDGGSFALGPLPEAGTYYFRLVARSKSAQFSEPSDRVEQELAITSIDLEITDAWLTGEAAQNTADGKNSIWRGPDEPELDPDRPFKDGDIWFEMTEDGKSIPNIWDEDAGAWVGNDDYRQSEIERVQDELRQELDDIIIDGSGTKNFYTPTMPTEGMREGDLWFDSSDSNKPYIYQDGEWITVRDSFSPPGAGENVFALLDEAGTTKNAIDNQWTSVPGFTFTPGAVGVEAEVPAGAPAGTATVRLPLAGTFNTAGEWQITAEDVIRSNGLGLGGAGLLEFYSPGKVPTARIVLGVSLPGSGIFQLVQPLTVKEDEFGSSRTHSLQLDSQDLQVLGLYPSVYAWSLFLEVTVDSVPGNTIEGSVQLAYAVGGKGIAGGVITETKISDNAISTPKLQAGAIVAGKIAANAIETDHLDSKIVTTDKIATGAITAESGIIGSINAGTITVGEMDGARIKAGTIDADTVLVESSIGSTLIKDGAILTEHIRTGAITAESGIIGSIDANVITVGKIMGNQLDADAINGKTITGATIRTASSGARVELTQNGLKQYNALGATIVDMTAGSFTLQGGSITGSTIRTATSGSRVEITTQGLKQYNSSNEVIAEMVDGSMVMRGVLEQSNSVSTMRVGPQWSENSPGIQWTGGVFGGLSKPPSVSTLASTAPIGNETASGHALYMQGPAGSSYMQLGDRWTRVKSQGSGSNVAYFYQGVDFTILDSRQSSARDAYLYMNSKSGDESSLTRMFNAGSNYGAWVRLTDSMIDLTYNGSGTGNSSILRLEGGNLQLYGTRIQSPTIYNTNTADRPVYINQSTGSLGKGPSSSLRYKQEVEPGRTLDSILDIDLASWRYKHEIEAFAEAEAARGEVGVGPLPASVSEVPTAPRRHYGAIAEQVDELGLSELVFYDAFGRPDALKYELFGVALIPIVRSLRDRIESLEAQLASA